MPGPRLSLLKLVRYLAWFYGTSVRLGLWAGSLLGLGVGVVEGDPWLAAAAGTMLLTGHAATSRILNAIYPA